MKFVITNPDFEKSDCEKCGRAGEGLCKLWKNFPERWIPIKVAQRMFDRCGYYCKEDY